jgi:sugar lactone lactonase YvrE
MRAITAWSGTPGLLSEGPRWHAERQELLWIDILGRQVHRGTVGTNGGMERLETITVDRHVGAVAPAFAGGYVLAAGQGFLFLDDAGQVRELAQPEAGRTDVRMNDGACDPQGRFWAGTMAYDEAPGAGVLYRLELDGSCTAVLTGLTISNGIGWSPDGTAMYLNDSGTASIYAFGFDGSSGAISDRRTLVHIEEPGVAPDGLTVDEEGGIWAALWGGGAVNRYRPDGSLLESIELPVERPTSCAFGGPDRATLFVTTARVDLDEAALSRQPEAGRVFAIDGLGVRGLPCLPYRGAVSRRRPSGASRSSSRPRGRAFPSRRRRSLRNAPREHPRGRRGGGRRELFSVPFPRHLKWSRWLPRRRVSTASVSTALGEAWEGRT